MPRMSALFKDICPLKYTNLTSGQVVGGLFSVAFRRVVCFRVCFKTPIKLSHLMGKPTICIEENKDADQLRGNREADQRLCFHYSDSIIPFLLKSKISSF